MCPGRACVRCVASRYVGNLSWNTTEQTLNEVRVLLDLMVSVILVAKLLRFAPRLCRLRQTVGLQVVWSDHRRTFVPLRPSGRRLALSHLIGQRLRSCIEL